MAARASPIDLVRQLVEAENERNRAAAEAVLAEDFAAITRARGVEQDRDGLLDEIAQPKSSTVRRALGDDLWLHQSGDLAVVRSLVTTTDDAAPADAPKTYRNLHVFERRDGRWKCLAWQVSELR